MRVTPADPTPLGAAVMSDLGLVRYLGYAALPEAAALKVRLQAEQADALDNGVHLIVVQSADGSLVVNEMAPRPHNSGHYSMDACDVSQFELQVRAMTGLPLVQPRQHSAAIMLNLLGDLWFRQGDQAQTPPWAQVLALPGTHLHLYGKAEARRGRKMGHLNVTGADAQAVRATALQAAALLGIEAF